MELVNGDERRICLQHILFAWKASGHKATESWGSLYISPPHQGPRSYTGAAWPAPKESLSYPHQYIACYNPSWSRPSGQPYPPLSRRFARSVDNWLLSLWLVWSVVGKVLVLGLAT
uniref:Uncharacterized protein n=1 Tax=Kalanchoe fedtschenkoi TaxID=63787 RepID=A0A7N0T4B4_KALFE